MLMVKIYSNQIKNDSQLRNSIIHSVIYKIITFYVSQHVHVLVFQLLGF